MSISDEDIQQAFDLFDKSSSGSIAAADVGTAVRSLGHAPSEEDLEEMLAGASSIDLAKFTEIYNKTDCPSVDEVVEAFSTFDLHSHGYIPIKELQKLMETLGEGMDKDVVTKFVALCEPDSEGMVNYRHLCDVMCNDL